MLKNKWLDATVKGPDGKSVKTANRDFAKQLSMWTFKETGVLKAGKIDHYLTSDSSEKGHNNSQLGYLNPAIYRIKNDVVSWRSSMT